MNARCAVNDCQPADNDAGAAVARIDASLRPAPNAARVSAAVDRSLRETVAALRSTDAYPDNPRSVEAIETHKSWVFLTDRHAWKLKKPVRFNSVDFTTVAARRANCEQEVRLNRRLAPDVYLGVVALARTATGLRIGGDGEVVDWLIQMRRLPRGRTLRALAQAGALAGDDIRTVGQELAMFYRGLSPALTDAAEYHQLLAREIALNDATVETDAPACLRPRFDRISTALRSLLEREPALLGERARAGHVIEGHGDLRPEHVCLEDGRPLIIDCLEFDRRLRVLDAVDELSFLALELERIGASFTRPILLDTYTEVTGDCPPEQLTRFYTSYRASIWARLAIWRMRELPAPDNTRWLRRAAEYLQLAETYLPLSAGRNH
jgi:aminoglycoside phosphotransferase family enzyme